MGIKGEGERRRGELGKWGKRRHPLSFVHTSLRKKREKKRGGPLTWENKREGSGEGKNIRSAALSSYH